MQIGLFGYSDKRHIVYTLIRVLGGLGRTIFLTPNQQYLMLSEDRVSNFEIFDVHIVVYSCDINELDDEFDLNSYEYVIYDVLKDVPSTVDAGVLLDSRELYLFDLEDRDIQGVRLFTACKMDKQDLVRNESLIMLPPASFVEPVLQEMFDRHILLPVRNQIFVKGMSRLVMELTGLPSSRIHTLLKKGEMKV